MKKYVKLGLLVLWMAVIFMFSAQAATDSTNTTNIVIDICYKIYKTLFIGGKLSIEEFSVAFFTPVRKLAHFSEFLILGILAYLNVEEFIKNKTIVLATVFSGLYAISDEIHQIFVPGRACLIKDMFIDLAGSILGILIIHLIYKRWRKK